MTTGPDRWRDHTTPIKAVTDTEADPNRSYREDALMAEIRRLSGCLLVIAGAEGCGNGSLRTAAYEAASMGATVADLAGKLGSPVPG